MSTFLKKVKAVPIEHRPPVKNQLDLATALAWVRGEITSYQINKALGGPRASGSGNVLYAIASRLREGVMSGKIKIT